MSDLPVKFSLVLGAPTFASPSKALSLVGWQTRRFAIKLEDPEDFFDSTFIKQLGRSFFKASSSMCSTSFHGLIPNDNIVIWNYDVLFVDF